MQLNPRAALAAVAISALVAPITAVAVGATAGDHPGCCRTWLSATCEYSTAHTPEPQACPAVGEAWEWPRVGSRSCAWRAVPVQTPSCPAGEDPVWQSDICEWDCEAVAGSCETTAPSSGAQCAIAITDCNGDGYTDSGLWANGTQSTIDGTVQTVHFSPVWNASERTWYATCVYLGSLGGGLGLPTARTASHACKRCP